MTSSTREVHAMTDEEYKALRQREKELDREFREKMEEFDKLREKMYTELRERQDEINRISRVLSNERARRYFENTMKHISDIYKNVAVAEETAEGIVKECSK